MNVAEAERRAHELVLFAAAFADAGHVELARRSAVVADDLLIALDELAAERSARRAMQETRDRLERILLTGRRFESAEALAAAEVDAA